MIKRILALALTILTALTMVISVSAADTLTDAANTAVELTEAEKFFIGIGVIDGDRYLPYAVPSRAEFAEFLVKTANLNATVTDEMSEAVFVDVPATHANYSAIKAVHSYGLMGGVGNSKFAPDYNIVLNQALKVLVDLMGYTPYAKREGGYPGGYLTVAGRLNLLKKVSGMATNDANYRDVLQIFYNAIDVEVQAITGATDSGVIHGKGGETFAKAVLKLKKLEGRITDNGLTSLTGASRVNEKEMVIAGTTVDVTDELAYARDYIGMDVDAYYRTDAEAEKPLAYVSLDRNDSLTFDLSDFVSITQSKVTYNNGNRNVTENLANGFTMIYNGAIFDPVIPSALVGLSGEMTLVATDGRNYDLVVVNSYENIFVASIDKTEKIIYNGIKYKPGYTNTKVLNFSNSSTYDFLNVVTYDGLQSSFDRIREGDVISAKVSRDKRVVTLIVEREFTETFVLDNYETKADTCTIYDSENAYKIPDFNKLLLPDLIRGKEYTVHFNKFGDVAWMEMAGSDYPMAFLTGAESTGGNLSKKYSVRLYTTDDEFLTLSLDERVYYNNFNKKTEDVFGELSTYVGSAVLYEAEEGVLTRIVMPEELGVESNRGWYRISPKVDGEDPNQTYWSTVGEWRHVGDKFAFVDGTTIGMYVPPARTNYNDDSRYGIFKSSDKRNGESMAVEGYSREFNNVVADLEVRKTTNSGMSGERLEMLLISDMSTRVNDEGEPVKVLNGYKTSYFSNGVTKVSYPVSADVNVSGCGLVNIDDISAGDIMMFSLNGNDELKALEVVYDYSSGISNDISNRCVDKGYIYASGDNWTRTTAIAPEALDMTNVNDYIQTVGRHHRNPDSLIIVTNIDGGLFFDVSTVSDLKSYTKTYGEYDYLVTLSNGEDSIFGSVAYR